MEQLKTNFSHPAGPGLLSGWKWKFGWMRERARPINELGRAKYAIVPGKLRAAPTELFTDAEKALPRLGRGRLPAVRKVRHARGWIRYDFTQFRGQRNIVRRWRDVSRRRVIDEKGKERFTKGKRNSRETKGTKGLSVERLARPIARCQWHTTATLFNLDRFQADRTIL